MKPQPLEPGTLAARRAGAGGFSFTEMLVAGSVFSLVMIAVVTSNLYGLGMLKVAQPKLAAENEARQLFNRLSDEISSAKLIAVGEGDAVSFTPVDAGTPWQGGALQLWPTSDTNAFTRYYRDPADQILKRWSSDSPQVQEIAKAVTNSLVFAVVDYRGFPDGLLTNDQRHLAIHVLLQFSEIEGTRTPIGPESYFKSHQFEIEIARRSN